jgi:transcriptional regulator with XRE-family HTH domain
MNKVYSNILKLRKANSLSQTDLAEKLGISQDAVSKLEKGGVQLTIERLEQLAEIFGMSIDDILHYGEEKTQIVDNEKAKELENKVLLLEKDLEICKNRYELKMNEIENYVYKVLKFYGIIDNLIKNSYSTFSHNLGYDLADKQKTMTYFNNIKHTDIVKHMKEEIRDNTYRIIHVGVFDLIDDEKYTTFFMNTIMSIYGAVNIDFDRYAEAVALHKRTGVYGNTGEYREAGFKIELKGLNEYKPNPNYPPQTGFFRIENL